MTDRAHVFTAGPAVLPVDVLKKASEAVRNYNGLGISLVEMSHRSKDFKKIHEEAKVNIREIYNVPQDYEILFMQGGASLQFAMIPLNFLKDGDTAHFVNTGSWSTKAFKEAKNVGSAEVIASSEDKDYTYIPENVPDTGAAYVHLTSNNTIRGTQYFKYPEIKKSPIICDMSSDIFSKKIDVSDFGMIYAGAQKNAGPSGLTIIIARKDLLEKASSPVAYLNYKTHIKADSLYNTPCTFATYAVGEVLKWIKAEGGLDAIEKRNKKKADILYSAIDNSDGYFKAPVRKEDRSWMNVPFRLPSEELEAKFLKEAEEKNFIGIRGHRSVGGIRASIYNALPIESVEALVDLMEKFRKNNS